MRRGGGGVCVGSSGRSRRRGVCCGGGCGRSWGVPPGHRVRGLLRSVWFRPWGVRPALGGACSLPPPRGRAGGPSPRAVSGRRVAVSCGVSVLVRRGLGVVGVCGVRSWARPSRGPVGSGGSVVRLCGSARWWVVGAPVGAPFFACAPAACLSPCVAWIEHGQSQSQRQGQKVGGQEKSWPPKKWSSVRSRRASRASPSGTLAGTLDALCCIPLPSVAGAWILRAGTRGTPCAARDPHEWS